LIQRVDAGSSQSTVMTGMPCLFWIPVFSNTNSTWKNVVYKFTSFMAAAEAGYKMDWQRKTEKDESCR
jgi:hypothetical protein